ncbi:MAG TPA: hypothetical protein VGJ81_21410 [Thermoanaerobaculia bacterium]
MSEGPTPMHDVFTNPNLLVSLLISQTDIGYKLVTFYTASATLYLAAAGALFQQYFASVLSHQATKATGIAWFGLVLSVASLAAPFGIQQSRKEIEHRAARYADALGLPHERFTVVRFGGWLSLVVFAMICVAWTYLVATGMK